MKAMTWEDILKDRSLQDLPYKIETNRQNQIIMSSASYWHSDYQLEIAALLREMLPAGRASVECAVQTAEGVRVADAAWIRSRAGIFEISTFPVIGDNLWPPPAAPLAVRGVCRQDLEL